MLDAASTDAGRWLVTRALLAVDAAVGGAAIASIGWTIAAGGTDLAPYVQGGAISILATAVGYVLKQFADSKIVTFPIAEIIRKASDREKELELKNDERERRLQRLLDDTRKLLDESIARESEAKDREDSLKALLIQRGAK